MDNYTPVIGKTYTLFGDNISTQQYYSTIRSLTDQILGHIALSEHELLIYLQKVSSNRRSLRKKLRQGLPESRLGRILNLLHESLATFTPGVEQHLKKEPVYKCITDKTILSTREQYYLYMIEIELVNRLYKKSFLDSIYKIALLPYCLKATQTDCKASPDEIDYICKGCLKTCYINKVSTLLKEHNIHPYIWRTIRLKTLLKQLIIKHGSVGVMGIACIVELTMGMRSCIKARVPVIGFPLNANRCIRWMGDFYENSVDLEKLNTLVT